MENTQFKYAGFWKRFLAYLIDSIILGFISMILLVPIWIIFGLSIFSLDGIDNYDDFVNTAVNIQHYDDEFSIAIFSVLFLTIIAIAIFSTIISWLYFALMESSAKQATLGKMALGIKVTDMLGNRITFGRATGRYFSKILSGLILYIGYIMIAFTDKKQGLHDMIANTLVINIDTK
jgi:uncharacterized RDD family membrane protein YckC